MFQLTSKSHFVSLAVLISAQMGKLTLCLLNVAKNQYHKMVGGAIYKRARNISSPPAAIAQLMHVPVSCEL